MNSEISKTSDPHRLLLNLLDKIKIKNKDKYVDLSNLSIYYTCISPKNFIFLKTFNSEFPYIVVWFTDQNSKPKETEDKINITLVFN